MATIFSTSRLAALLTLDVTRFLAGTKLAEDALFKLGGVLQNFGRNLIRGPLVALGFLSAQAIKVAADFDELTAQLRAVSGGAGIADLTENARRLGRTTKFTATEIQNLQVELAKLGFGTDSIIGTVKNAADITQVFGGDLVKTGNTIAEVTRQFSRENLSAARVADVMAVAFSKTALNTDNFAQAMKNVGSISNITNNDFVDTVTLLGLLANAGQKSGIAGTRLKGVLIRLSKELGVTGSEIDFLLDGQLQFNELIEFFRNRAGVAAAVIGEMGDEFAVLRRQIDESNGAASAFAGTVEDRLFFNIDRLKAATEDLAITFGTGFEPLVARLAIGFESLADSFAKADPNAVRFGANMALLLTIIPAFNFVVGGLLQAIASLRFGLGQLVLAITLVSASFARGLTVYASTSGLIRKVKEETTGLIASLDKTKVDNVQNLEDRIAALRSELQKLSESDGIDTDILATATSRFTTEIDRLETRLKKIDDFNFTGTIARIEEIRRKQILAGRESGALLRERAKLEAQITNSRIKQVAAGGDSSFLGRAVGDVRDQLEQELEFVELDIAFRKINLQNFDQQIEDLKNDLVTADLSFLNIPQLEAEIIKYQEQLDDAVTATNQFENTIDDVTADGFFGVIDNELRLLEIGLARTFGQGDWRAGLALLGNLYVGNAQSLALLNAESAAAIDVVNFQNEVVGNFTDELQRQQDALQAVTREFADFGGNAGVLGAGEKLADLFEQIRKVTASFGEQSNKLDEASAVIAQYNTNLEDTISAAELVAQITREGFDLASLLDLNALGNLQQQIDFVKGLVAAFRDLAVERLAEGQRSLASQANAAADALERQLNILLGIDRRANIRETVQSAKDLSASLLDLGRTTRLEKLESDANQLKASLREALINPEDSQLADDLLLDLERVERKIKQLTDREAIDAIFGDNVSAQLAVNAAKVSEGFGSVADSYGLVVSLAERKLLGLFEEQAAGNTALSMQEVTDATNALITALDNERVYLFSQSLKDFKDGITEVAGSFENALDSGQFRSDIDAYGAAISILIDRVNEAVELLKEAPEGETGFLENQIKADTEAIKQLQDQLNRLQFSQAIVDRLTQGLQRFGDEVLRAVDNGEKFGDAIVNAFKEMAKQILARLAVLTAAFIIASAFGVPVGKFGSFLADGFGLPSSGGVSSAGVSDLLNVLDASNRNLAVEGSISGNNIVISNQRGTRAIDRTFG